MATAAVAVERQGTTRTLFIVTVFTGSFLLFLMQPMVARMALPRLGGAPAVWNSAMLVYQALLLGGYAYAHLASRLRPAFQGLVHLALFAFAALRLPLGLSAMTPPAGASPILWVPGLLIGSIGPLFFVVSAQAPLMQRWLALREPGANPYALYAASNLGSFGGLIAYPTILEPFLPLDAQSASWSMGYVLLCILLAGCVLVLPKGASAAVAARPVDDAPPSMAMRLKWIALAAVPSGLIYATTTHITTDILAIPLIWVAPLGLYLLSFTFAFTDEGHIAAGISRFFPIVLIIAGATAGSGIVGNLWLLMAGDLLIMFTGAVTLHSQLYRLRPGPARLTDFYLCTSVGGVVAGIFCALIAPALFDWLYEYPLLILGAALLMPPPVHASPLSPIQRLWIPIAAILLAMLSRGMLFGATPAILTAMALIMIALLTRFAVANRFVFALCLGSLILGLGCGANVVRSIDHYTRTRSYFGIYTVGDVGKGEQKARVFVHGNTSHGFQLLDPALTTYPTSYFAPRAGIGIAMQAAPALFGPHARIGVVGLGAGTLACYAQPGQSWRFYEIDPAVVRIARDPRRFTFLSRCLPGVPVDVGDARLTLATRPTASHDLLTIDAFSSDAIPMHLLTREAFETYARVLVPGGLLMVHISNNYVELQPVLAALAAAKGWHVMVRQYQPDANAIKRRAATSLWVAMSQSRTTIDCLRAADRTAAWKPIAARPGFPVWTDQYGSIVPLLKGF